MRIVDEKLLDLSRGPGVCEVCGKKVRNREPHHIFARGHGSGGRLDVAINIVATCSAFSGGEDCHTKIHAGAIRRERLLAIVATREGRSVQSIKDEIWKLQRTPKQ